MGMSRRVKASGSAFFVWLESILEEADEVANQHEDLSLFQSFPGAGPTYAPRLLVAFGEQRDRYANAGDAQKYGGIAPVVERSGKKVWIHWRYHCPKFLRQTFVEWAGQTINKSYWAANTIANNVTKAANTRLPYGHWLLNGSGFSFGAGRPARLTMN